MRILEWMLVLVSLTTALFMLVAPRRRTFTIGSLMALVLAVLLHGIIDHFRVQMLPTYIVASVLLIVGIVRFVKLGRRGRHVQSTHQNMNKQIPRHRSGILLKGNTGYVAAAQSGGHGE